MLTNYNTSLTSPMNMSFTPMDLAFPQAQVNFCPAQTPYLQSTDFYKIIKEVADELPETDNEIAIFDSEPLTPEEMEALRHTIKSTKSSKCLPSEHSIIPVKEGEMADCRPLLTIVKDSVMAIGREILYGLGQVPGRVKDKFGLMPDYVTPAGENNHWRQDNEGLYVLIHGLNGHPSAWDGQASDLKDKHPEAEIRQVRVPKNGNCGLEEAADPILKMVKDYIEKNPGKPICLFGVSNGGRIAAYIEKELRDIPGAIKVSTVAGVHYGSGLMSFLNDVGVSPWLFEEEVRDELAFGSEKSKQLIKDQRVKLNEGVARDFEFYTATEDSRLWNYHGALPKIHQNEKHYLVHGEEHGSIVERVREQQVSNAIQWMRHNKKVEND